MATATQQPTFFDDDNYAFFIAEAKRRYPFSSKHGRVRGRGRYALISKCTVPWRVFLFDTAQQRADAVDRWGWNTCSSARCSHQHFSEDL
jgi:hypothetical protein